MVAGESPSLCRIRACRFLDLFVRWNMYDWHLRVWKAGCPEPRRMRFTSLRLVVSTPSAATLTGPFYNDMLSRYCRDRYFQQGYWTRGSRAIVDCASRRTLLGNKHAIPLPFIPSQRVSSQRMPSQRMPTAIGQKTVGNNRDFAGVPHRKIYRQKATITLTTLRTYTSSCKPFAPCCVFGVALRFAALSPTRQRGATEAIGYRQKVN